MFFQCTGTFLKGNNDTIVRFQMKNIFKIKRRLYCQYWLWYRKFEISQYGYLIYINVKKHFMKKDKMNYFIKNGYKKEVPQKTKKNVF